MPSHTIAILGSTGSIGTAALDVLTHLGDDYKATALSTHTQIDLLIQQVEKHKPTLAIITGPEPTPTQRSALTRQGKTKLLLGAQALDQAATDEHTDTVLASIVGAAGLPSTFAAVTAGKRIALANKESLVIAGSLLMPLAAKTGAQILPVDSEHSAIFQAAQAGKRHEVKKVLLTASGGPFRTTPLEELQTATAKQALAHPTWQMGKKVTIDSATMFNKAFELLEALHLFALTPDQIDILIHPQSLIHSMVEFTDGSTLAQLSPPNMRLPIQYALTYPHRIHGCCKTMDWTKPVEMTFTPPDPERFPSIPLAYTAARTGGTLPAVMNAANEIAVEAFLQNQIPFAQIATIVSQTMQAHTPLPTPTLVDLLAADQSARQQAKKFISAL